VAELLGLFLSIPGYWGKDSQRVRWGPIAVCLVGLEALHALSCPIAASLLDQCEIGPQPQPLL